MVRSKNSDRGSRGVALQSGACTLWLYDPTLTTLTTLSLCGKLPNFGNIGRFLWTEDGDFYVGDSVGSVTRFSSTGVIKWVNSQPAGASFLTGMTVDRVGRVFASTSDAAGAITLRQITPAGTIGFQTHPLPSGFSTFDLRVDPNGNFYALGQSSNGLGGLTPTFGGLDVVVLKNPQLTFP